MTEEIITEINALLQQLSAEEIAEFICLLTAQTPQAYL